MASVLDNWNPPVLDKPDYYHTVKYVYKHIEFHISEDEAYAILNAFIEKWDDSAGQSIREEELVQHVVKQLENNLDVILPTKKIKRIVELIMAYLFETGHFYQHELKGVRE